MRNLKGEVVPYSEIIDATPAELEAVRRNPERPLVVGQLLIPTGPLLPRFLRKLFRQDRYLVPGPREGVDL